MKPHRIRMTHNLISNYGLCDEYEYDAPDPTAEGARVVNDITYGMGPDVQDAAKWERRTMAGPRGKAMQVFVSSLVVLCIGVLSHLAGVLTLHTEAPPCHQD
jgi:hypothetical protein